MKAWLAGIVLLACSSLLPAHAMINLRCSNYSIDYPQPDGTITTGYGSYCWWEWSPDPYDPPYNPPIIPAPPGVPGVPHPNMCQNTLDNWPDGCSKITQPIVETNGCNVMPDNIDSVGITSACNAHDMCYSAVGNSKSSCDDTFGEDISSICHSYYGPGIYYYKLHPENFGRMKRQALIVSRDLCVTTGWSYSHALYLVPKSKYYNPAQKVGKCIKAHEDRDQYCGD